MIFNFHIRKKDITPDLNVAKIVEKQIPNLIPNTLGINKRTCFFRLKDYQGLFLCGETPQEYRDWYENFDMSQKEKRRPIRPLSWNFRMIYHENCLLYEETSP